MVTYPNGQSTVYSYFTAAAGDLRLQEIKNLGSGATVISKFDYTYDKVGNIETWARQLDTASSTYTFGYDATNQLLSASLSGSVSQANKYAYDPAGNRTLEQLGQSPTQATFNNLNQLISRSGTGSMVFEGNLSEPGIVTYSGSNTIATDGTDNHFRFTAPVTTGSNSIPITAKDGSNNTTSKTIKVNVTAGTSQPSLQYDLNGNLISDGTRTFEWDAENRLVAVNESGTLRSEFSYDGLSRRVQIVEKSNGTVTSTKNLVWAGLEIAEERDASNVVTKRYDPQGVQIGAANYFYTRDHLGSIREFTDNSEAIQARYDYDPYGRRTKLGGSMDADFGFTGHYQHIASALTLAPYRAYDANLGRWLSRDPIAEQGGLNLYGYVGNCPINVVDPYGLIGWGFVGNASATGGTGWGATGSISIGAGMFFDGAKVAPGGYVSAVGSTAAGNFGISAGAGIGMFLTNANQPCDLKRTTDTISIDLGALGMDFGLSLSWGNGIFNLEIVPGATPLPITGSISWVSTSHNLSGPTINQTGAGGL